MNFVKFSWFYGLIPISILILSTLVIVTVINIIVKIRVKDGHKKFLESTFAFLSTITLLLIINSLSNNVLSSFIGYLVSSIMTIPVTA